MNRFFASNEGNADRVIRVIVGLALLTLTVAGPKTLWGLVGLVPLITGLAGTCPLYSVLGIKTCPVTPNKAIQS